MCKRADDLHHIGDVKAYYKGDRINLPKLPEAPSELASNKIERLSEWLDKTVHEDLVHVVASELKGATKLELHGKTAIGSELDKKIQKVVVQKAQEVSKEFPKAFGSTQRAKNTAMTDIATNVSRGILRELRAEIRGQEARIDRVIAAKVAKAIQATSTPDDELFVSSALSSYTGAEDELKMYQDMTRKSLSLSKIDSIHHVYRAQPVACNTCPKSRQAATEQKEDQDSEYYANYYYGRDVYDRYNAFAGRAVFMDPSPKTVIKEEEPLPEPSLRGARLRKKLYQQQMQVEERIPALGSKTQPRVTKSSLGPKTAVNSPLPPLGPKSSSSFPRVPPAVPIEHDMPEFVPLKEKATFVPFKAADERKPAFVKIAQTPVAEELLPNFDDMLKKVEAKNK